ncbi:MAG TPA: hypothetical protein VH475_26840 [Tepidisphaeraceae bacterium]
MMAQPPSDLELMAYADGELDAAAAEGVRRYVESDAGAARKLEAYRKLRETAGRVLAVRLPEGLEHRIDAQATRAALQAPRWHIGWVGGAVAAVLLLGIASVVIWSTFAREPGAIHDSPLVPVAWVSSAATVHVNCSKHEDHHGAPFPRDLSELPESIHEFLGCDARCPDFSNVGYQFAGCASCTVKDDKTAHLLYRPTGAPEPCISLFVQNDVGQLAIETGKYYFARDAHEDVPMIIWRDNGAVYYLVGEDDRHLKAVAAAMGLKVRL